MVEGQTAVNSFTMFLIRLRYCSAAHDCSTAKKRRAGEQALGVPVNKRKSLLMKPRHYSPSQDCEEGRAERTADALGQDGPPETHHHPGAGSEEEWPQLDFLPAHRARPTLGEHAVCMVGKANPSVRAKPDMGFPQHPLMRTQDSGDIGLPEAIQAGGAGPTTRPQSLDLRPGRSPSTPCTDPPIPKAVGEHSKCDVDDGELG
ncbi:hypothetical protein J1605_001931 [Eschrichtius robustus]|uniref:Uncharacterized protein n=1 Tax=Eschrichtius robustus TaxID=9764 RepID=A0AB34I1Y4_ESCRO|nr:hypothetical protein J1605_001931 [Eschrichtius robustus]